MSWPFDNANEYYEEMCRKYGLEPLYFHGYPIVWDKIMDEVEKSSRDN